MQTCPPEADRSALSAGVQGLPAAPKRGSPEGEYPPLAGVSGGVPLSLVDFPRVGGWEEQRSCCGKDADIAHRAQRSPATSCNETQTAKHAPPRRADILPAAVFP